MKYFLLVIVLAMTACGAPAAVPPTPDIGAIQTGAVQTVMASIPTQPPPTVAPALPTDTAVPATGAGSIFAWNYIGSQESGGLRVEIARFVVADKLALTDFDFTGGGRIKVFDDRPVVSEIIFKITNTTQEKINIYPDQGKVIAGGEQVDLLDFAIQGSTFGDDFSGEIFPGVTVIGGMWFGFKRTPVDQITSATIAFSGPSGDSFNSLGPEFNIVLDLSNRQNQPIPDELK